jgi:hypothetical protein
MSWNGFPRKLSRKLWTLFKPSSPNPKNSNNTVIDLTTIKIWIHLPFLGKYGTKLTNNFIRKISPLLKSPCKFIVNWKTTDTNCFITLKDPTPKTYQSSVVYEFKCPGCNANYVGKLIAAYIPVLKNILLLTLLKYITILLAVMNSIL